MFKQLHHVIPCALLFAAGLFSMQAHALTDDERLARIENDIMKLHLKQQPAPVVAGLYPTGPAPSYLVPPAPHRPYDWTGGYVGAFGAAVADDRGTNLGVPTYGNLQGNDIGFGPSSLGNSYAVDSQTYNNLANGANSNANAPGMLNGPFVPGYTTYTATATATGFANNGNNTGFVGVGTNTTNNGLANAGINSFANVAPYNNLPGDRSDSQLTQKDNARRLLGSLGGEVGYRKQFGLFVIGVEADGSILDGKRNDTANSTGQFSNNQGANTVAQAAECYAGNGNNGCGASGTNNSTGNVNVTNNGNSSFTQNISAGPKWLGTARLSAGFSADRVLLYATGGLAYGQSDLAVSATYRDVANSTCSGNFSATNGVVAGNTAVSYSCNGVAQAGSSFTYSNAAQYGGYRSKLLTGIAVGGGAAYAMTDNIIFKLEGIYYDLGSISTTAYGSGSQTLTVNSGAGPAGVAPGTRAASVTPYVVTRTVTGFLGKIGIAYKFNTGTPDPVLVPVADPIVARY